MSSEVNSITPSGSGDYECNDDLSSESVISTAPAAARSFDANSDGQEDSKEVDGEISIDRVGSDHSEYSNVKKKAGDLHAVAAQGRAKQEDDKSKDKDADLVVGASPSKQQTVKGVAVLGDGQLGSVVNDTAQDDGTCEINGADRSERAKAV